MQTVVLTEQEWQQVLGIIAQAPWNIANPLLMKIGEQLRIAAGGVGGTFPPEPKPREGMEIPRGKVNG